MGYLKVEEKEVEGFLGKNKRIEFTLVQDKNISYLTDIQMTILDFIKSNLENGRFSFDRIQLFNIGYPIGYAFNSYRFSFIALVNTLTARCINLLKSKDYLDMSDHNLMNLIFGIWFVIAMLSPMLLSKELIINSTLFFGLFASVFLSSILVVFLNMKPEILGRWSREEESNMRRC